MQTFVSASACVLFDTGPHCIAGSDLPMPILSCDVAARLNRSPARVFWCESTDISNDQQFAVQSAPCTTVQRSFCDVSACDCMPSLFTYGSPFPAVQTTCETGLAHPCSLPVRTKCVRNLSIFFFLLLLFMCHVFTGWFATCR